MPAPVPVEDSPGLRSVQPDRPDPRMSVDQAFEVVDDRGPDVRIQASFPLGRLQDIPQRDSVPAEKRQSRFMIRFDGLVVDAGKNPPEVVAGVCVVFPGRQRGIAREGAEDQDTGSAVGYGVESLFHRHFIGISSKAWFAYNPPSAAKGPPIS